jgi:phytol kinase
MIPILIYTFLYCFSFFILEVLKRKKILSANSTRRIIHLGAAIIAFSFPIYLSLAQALIMCFIILMIMSFSRSISLLSHIHAVERKTWGEIFYPLGMMVVVLLFLPHNPVNYRIVILILGISDLLANIIGTHWGSKYFILFGGKKTIEGTLAFFVSIFVILLAFKIALPIAILISLVTSLVEFVSPYGSDNLTIPIVVSGLLIFFV